MSSVVVVQCTQGFVVSTDTVAFKTPVADKRFAKVRASTHKLFQISDDVIAAGVGEFTSYLKVFNAAAKLKLPTEKLVPELLDLATKKAADSRIFVLYRLDGKAKLDVCEFAHIRRDEPGAHSYPDDLLNGLFDRIYESPEGLAVRKAGILGIAALVNGINSLAASLSPEMSPPFDTICFLHEGMFVLSGGLAKLPLTEFS